MMAHFEGEKDGASSDSRNKPTRPRRNSAVDREGNSSHGG